MNVYLVLMECHDLYCEGQHVAGVYTFRNGADVGLEDALKMNRYFAGAIVELASDNPPVEELAAPLVAAHR